MIVQRRGSDLERVVGPASTYGKARALIAPHVDALAKRLYRRRSRTPFSVAQIGAKHWLRELQEFNPNIVHLHWINGGFVRPEQLRKINAPMVWSLHDMWAFTGGCHYNNDGCEAFTDRCGSCPVLGSSHTRDLSRRIWNRKKRAYTQLDNLTVVGLSSWLAEEAKRSALFGSRPVVNLPNPINTNQFRPIDRTVARELWGIPQDAKVVLFGAMSATSDLRKGYDLLLKALEHIVDTKVQLCVFGASHGNGNTLAGLPVQYVGRLHDDVSLVTLYSAADVMIVPSRQENLSNAIMESMSCGTPVVGFDIGGNGDMIDHGSNGYLAEPYEPADLAEGLRCVLADAESSGKFAAAAREKVERCFSYDVVAQQYIELYQSILTA